MRFTPRLLSLALLTAASTPAWSQTGVRLRVGYGSSGDYRLRSGGVARVEGPEIALVFPLTSANGFSLALEPSIFGGGRLRRGGDADADVYRFLLTGRKTLGASRAYATFGVGFAHSSLRGGAASGASGVVGQVGAGLPISGFLARFRPTVEVNYFLADNGQLRGLFLGLTGGF